MCANVSSNTQGKTAPPAGMQKGRASPGPLFVPTLPARHPPGAQKPPWLAGNALLLTDPHPSRGHLRGRSRPTPPPPHSATQLSAQLCSFLYASVPPPGDGKLFKGPAPSPKNFTFHPFPLRLAAARPLPRRYSSVGHGDSIAIAPVVPGFSPRCARTHTRPARLDPKDPRIRARPSAPRSSRTGRLAGPLTWTVARCLRSTVNQLGQVLRPQNLALPARGGA